MLALCGCTPPRPDVPSEHLTAPARRDASPDTSAPTPAGPWLITSETNRITATRQGLASTVTLFDEVETRQTCTRDTLPEILERFPPEALYSGRARHVATVGDYITLELFESRMCQGGAHPDNIHALRTYLLPDAASPVPLSAIFPPSEIEAAIARDAFFTRLLEYTRTRDEALLQDDPDTACLFEVSVPDASTTSWAFAQVDATRELVEVALLIDNPVHMCGGFDVRRTITLPLPEALREPLSRAAHDHTLYTPTETTP